MNAPLLVTAAVCVGAPTLLAAALLYRERIRPTDQRLDQLLDDEHQIVDSEDHGHEPTDIEQQIIDNLRGSAVPEQCVWRAACSTCGEAVYYQDCPTGGWWIHDRHPADSHEAVPRAETTGRMRDRAMEQFRASCVADIQTHAPRPVFATAEDLLAEVRRVWDLPAPQPADDGDGVFTADELEQQVAAYEKAAADRFRHAGVTWPTNPATVGTARYDSKAGK